ncbi:XRE family transcriptional regulator [Saccharopolyspora sp. NFXS83]|uniref:helix-turn-helix domain-containing protein n=1 Tax=Saccharopolyspora sp. NFXS83 TaxID=2993560 RepID=UPI00224B1D74|nr:XRE family transcriptional regulator [Saccharopolyspora sp. NFXS83]MCX2728768.1 XRE family transcriptional regulator [Saccharopolyspora sp. NFXS83]
MFTPERLILARKRRRLTLAALSRASDVSAQSITAFENSRKVPSDETLLSLAKALSYPVDFFYGGAHEEIQADAASFRALSKMSAIERDSTLASGAVALMLNSWIEERFRLPKPNVPTYPDCSPEEAAERVRASWGLGESPVPNMVRILESNGVRVFSLSSDCEDADAFSAIRSGVPFVFLSIKKTGERGRFDAAHELGHLVLHCEYRIPHGPAAESEANKFASAFLMPRSALFSQGLENASIERILSAKRVWGVSAMALTYRLRDLSIISEWKYNQIVKELARRGYRKSEPGSSLGRETSELLAKVFKELRRRGVKPAEVAQELNIYSSELSEHVFGLVPVQISGGGQRSNPVRPDLRVINS